MEERQITMAKKIPMPSSSQAIDIERLLMQAVEKGLSVDSLERLLEMRTQLKTEWARDEFYRELALFQSKCPIIIKTRQVFDKSGKLRYKFASLDEIIAKIKTPLKKHGFSYTIKTRQENESVTAIVEAHHVAGHTEVTDFTVPIDPSAYMNAAQKVASALTYSKRYAFCNAFGILTGDEDDDAQAQGNGKQSENRPPLRAPQTIAETKKVTQEKRDKIGPTKEQKELADKRHAELTELLKNPGLNGKKVIALIKASDMPEHRYDVTWLEMAITRTMQEIEKQEAILAANVEGEEIP